MNTQEKVIFYIFSFILFATNLSAHTIKFYPEADTLYIAGGCTPPVVEVTISKSVNQDSIIITPGWNTHIWTGQREQWDEEFEKAFFLIDNPENNFDYELWVEHKTHAPVEIIQVPFDSTYEFEAYKFYFKLKVIQNGAVIDSLSQYLIARVGVGIDILNNEGYSPQTTVLHQNFPNPFNASTTIAFSLPYRMSASLTLYNLLGIQLETMVNRELEAGENTYNLNMNNYPSGIYLIKLQTNDFVDFKKINYVR